MTNERLEEIKAFRSSPLTSKTMWTIYVSLCIEASLGHHYISVMADRVSPTVLMTLIACVGAIGITGVLGISWVDAAVHALQVTKGRTKPEE